MRLSIKMALYFAGVVLISGCAKNLASLEEATAESVNSVAVPKKFKSSYLGGRVRDGWLRSFRDPTLNYLVREAQKNSPDLKVASANVAEALAYMNMSIANLSPTVDAIGAYQFANWEIDKRHSTGNGALSVNWEPDLWGRVANDAESKREFTLSQQYLYEYARESLSANTAKAWFLLGSDRMVIDFYREVVKIQRDAKNILKKRADIGQGNMRDVHLSLGMLAEAKEALAKAEQSLKQDSRALEILIGHYPSAKLRGKYLRARLPRVSAGVPLSLLDRRPDIIAAKYQVASAFHNKKATELLKLPTVKIGGEIGIDIVRDAVAKVIGTLFMPIFDAGKIQAQMDVADAQQKKAIANYKKVVLNAYREVEDALSSERYLRKRFIHLSEMVREYKKAYDLTYKNYKIGKSDILDVLSVQSKWINAKIARTLILKDRLINRVNLYLSLGGKF